MSLEQLIKEASALTKDEQRKLMSHLVSLVQERERARELQEILDDKDPSHWVPLDQVEARFRSMQ